MNPLKKIILTIKQIDSTVLLFGGIGIIFIILGGLLLNQSSPNYQIGYPTTAIGFAFFVFAVSTDNAIKSAKKTDQILMKLEKMHEEIKKKN